MKKLIIILYSCIFSYIVFAQEQNKINKIKKVEVVGFKHKIHSINKKLFSVTTIDRRMIDDAAGNTLADILNQYLNITITPNASTGRSTISMFGLSGDYVKILVDNVPMVNDNGYGNDIDITQLNLDEIDHIEIAEGSMGVLYGDNAVAGVINIVTKKGISGLFNINATVQEEAVGGEYNLKYKGRHIQGLNIAHNITDRWFIKAGVSRNDFKGFFNQYKGKNHVGVQGKSIVSDELRGYEWSPKQSLSSYALLSYSKEKWKIYYKYNSYDEDLMFYDHTINTRLEKGEKGAYSYRVTAKDNNYLTHRFEHQVQLNGFLKNEANYQIIASYQVQKRRYKDLLYSLNDKRIQETLKDVTNQSSKLFFSKGILSSLFKKKSLFNLTLGYEITSQKGYDIIASGAYADKAHRVVEEVLSNYDFFTQCNLRLNSKLHFYPRLRLNNNSNYSAHLIWGATIDYKPADRFNIKAVVGSAYKTPTFTQLYFYMKDANHDIQGNKDLDPEDGISIMLSANKKFILGEKDYFMLAKIRGFHFNIKDRIDLVATKDDVFRYMNISDYKVLGVSLENQLNYNNLRFGLGINYNGLAQTLNKSENKNDYLFSLNMNAFAGYFITPIQAELSVQFKYNGKYQQYRFTGGDFYKGERQDFSWLDVSCQKSFFNRALEARAGARNLLNVIRVKTTLASGGAHSPDPTSALFGYGRSYFFQLKYHFNF